MRALPCSRMNEMQIESDRSDTLALIMQRGLNPAKFLLHASQRHCPLPMSTTFFWHFSPMHEGQKILSGLCILVTQQLMKKKWLWSMSFCLAIYSFISLIKLTLLAFSPASLPPLNWSSADKLSFLPGFCVRFLKFRRSFSPFCCRSEYHLLSEVVCQLTRLVYILESLSETFMLLPPKSETVTFLTAIALWICLSVI